MSLISDASTKDVIGGVTEDYEKLFELLKPVLYIYGANSESPNDKRIHIGLVAEDMFSAMESLGFTKENFCPYVEEVEAGEETTAVNTTELIVLNTYIIQRCIERITELESEVAKLKKTNVA